MRESSTGVEMAQRLAATADVQAEQVALRAAAARFATVAASPTRVRNAINSLHIGMAEASDALRMAGGRGGAPAGRVPRRRSPG